MRAIFGRKKEPERTLRLIVEYTVYPFSKDEADRWTKPQHIGMIETQTPETIFLAFVKGREQRKREWLSDYVDKVVMPELTAIETRMIRSIKKVRVTDNGGMW